jgi:MtN3 and saliva related transmembrane protein
MDMIIGEFAGFFASIVVTISMIPQMLKTIKTRDTSGLSIVMLALAFLGNLGWFLNGLAYGNMPLVMSGALLMVILIPIITIKILNEMAIQRLPEKVGIKQ